MVILCCDSTIFGVINRYCSKCNLRVKDYIGKFKIDERYKGTYAFALKYQVFNSLTMLDENYLFMGNKGQFGGWYLNDVRKLD